MAGFNWNQRNGCSPARRPGPSRHGSRAGPRDPCTEQYNDLDVICVLPPRWRLGRFANRAAEPRWRLGEITTERTTRIRDSGPSTLSPDAGRGAGPASRGERDRHSGCATTPRRSRSSESESSPTVRLVTPSHTAAQSTDSDDLLRRRSNFPAILDIVGSTGTPKFNGGKGGGPLEGEGGAATRLTDDARDSDAAVGGRARLPERHPPTTAPHAEHSAHRAIDQPPLRARAH